MQKQDIGDDEIADQSIYSTGEWSVLLPKQPVSPYHFLLLPNRNDVNQFTELNDDEIVSMKYLIASLIKKVENNNIIVNGYNLFSNNGTYEIGQHLNRFHQHIFVRIQNETESPYAIMADGRRWAEIGSGEWNERKEELRLLFNS